MQHILLDRPLNETIYLQRFHHQLLPMEVSYEKGFDTDIVNGLEKLGHTVVEDKSVTGFTAVTAISKLHGHVEAIFDPRRYGSIAVN